MAQSGYGKILLFDDFAGPEIPVATNVAYGTTAGGCNYYIGPFKVTGDLAETDTGVLGLARVNGSVKISGNDEDGKGVAIGSEVVFAPNLNGTIAVECRLSLDALTARVIWVGFVNANANDVAEVVKRTAGTTITAQATEFCGFAYDSQLTATDDWHMMYNGSTAATSTSTTYTSTDFVTDGFSAINTYMVVRVEIDSNGTARWYVDGDLKQTVKNDVIATTKFAGLVGAWGTTTTAASADIDYLAIEANRDWTTTFS